MNILTVRLFFCFLSMIVGHYVGLLLNGFDPTAGVWGAVIGLASSLFLIIFESQMRKYSMRNLSASVFGLIFGFFMAWVVSLIATLIPMDENLYVSLRIVFVLVFCYLGMAITLRGKDDFNIVVPYVRFVRQDVKEEVILLDTSAIIDGRIVDIAQTNFLEGKMYVPSFVLHELHQIADSADALKRQRGRRGLDILNKMQKMKDLDVKIYKEDYPEIPEVDNKLLKLSKVLSAKLFTTDFNLSKIAELEKVKTLNINDLSNALKVVYLPGEEMTVRIMKQGSEKAQGIAYLEDGTMIVVENAKFLIGQTINVTVTSVLQTSAGKMIFAENNDKSQQSKRPNTKRQD